MLRLPLSDSILVLYGSFRFLYRLIDITANIFCANLLIESGFCQYTVYMFIDPRKVSYGYALPRKDGKGLSQVMQTGRIYERNLTHTDDADFRFISHTFHDAVELIRYAEKRIGPSISYTSTPLGRERTSSS